MRYLLMLIAVLVATSANAAVLRVGSGCTFSTVQAAINAAQPNDELRLRTEQFTENLIVSQPLTIRGGYSSCSASTPNLFDRATIVAATSGAPTLIAGDSGATISLVRLNLTGANNTGGNGGGLLIDNGTRVEVDLVSVTGNQAELGGGIYVSGGNATLAGRAGAISLTVSGNTAGSVGGGVYVRTNGRVELLTTPVATLNIDNNSAGNQAGGLFFSGSLVELANASFDGNSAPNAGAIGNSPATSPARLELDDCSFSNNVANGTAGNGGALRLQRGPGGLEIVVRDCQFSDNQAPASQSFGGGALISGDADISMTRVSFSGNSAARGGGLAIAGAQLSLTGATFSQNSSSIDGGAFYVGANSLWQLKHAVAAPVLFSANTATGRGGAIYDVSGQTNQIAPGDIAGSTVDFDGNQANLGGAIYLSSGGAIGLSLPARFDNNVALTDGGAIYATGTSTFLFADGLGNPSSRLVFTGNQAAAKGGAVYLSNGASSTLDWVSIGAAGVGNSAQTGGGVYFDGDGELRMRNSVIADNTASAGAGVFLGSGADALIGAVHGPAGQMPLPGQPRNCDLNDLNPNQYCSLMAHNQASGLSATGGALHATFTSAVTVADTYVLGNSGSVGAAFAVMNGAEVLVRNSLIDGQNEAIFVDLNATLDLYHTTLTRNGNNTLLLADDPSTQLLLRNSILWANSQGLMGGASALLGGDCNITQSPQLSGLMASPEFVMDGRGNYRLGPTSPAVDACSSGDSSDMDGQDRPAAGSYDMGAFERTQISLPDPVFGDSFETPL